MLSDDDEFAYDDQLYETILKIAAEERMDRMEKRFKKNILSARKLWLKQVQNAIEINNEIQYFIQIVMLKSYLDNKTNLLLNKINIIDKLDLIEKLNKNIANFEVLNTLPSNVHIEFEALNKVLMEFINSFKCLSSDCDYGVKINEICDTINELNDLIVKVLFQWDESYNLSNNMVAEVLKLFSNECVDEAGPDTMVDMDKE